MENKKSPDASKPGFSVRFEAAMTETNMIDAMVQADGWTLAQYEASPAWLRQLYDRHAIAALREISKTEKAEHEQKLPKNK